MNNIIKNLFVATTIVVSVTLYSQEGVIHGTDEYDKYGRDVHWNKIEASSFLVSSKLNKNQYDSWKIFDGNEDTAWVEGVKGSGVGEWIKMSEPKNNKFYVFSYLWIKNGYTKNQNVYYINNRVKKIQLEFSEGEKTIIEFKDGIMEYQKVKLDQIKAKWVKVTILEVYKGSKYDDTCISELKFWRYDANWYKWGNLPIPEGIE